VKEQLHLVAKETPAALPPLAIASPRYADIGFRFNDRLTQSEHALQEGEPVCRDLRRAARLRCRHGARIASGRHDRRTVSG
jgi:hypothetical protein